MLRFLVFVSGIWSIEAGPHQQKLLLDNTADELQEALLSDDTCEDEQGCDLSLLQASTKQHNAGSAMLHAAESATQRGAKRKPQGEPRVLKSMGYDDAALQVMKLYVKDCYADDFNDWTSCVAEKCQDNWSGAYHVVMGLPSGWGASIRSSDSVFLQWGDYDAWVWSN
eukprot:TRINITY_DN77068_c0_g1_i1.p2 TRINITY_DN77068_c0_g1~~TRINITY_DN77068_c0_g1_i1.p2  ORF type:complete len:168 (+),score=47.75 TRINITY_DN77068_c0_g1_i1:94-597(+)